MSAEKTLGILMLDTKFPRINGDIGNVNSFDFTLNKLLVKEANPTTVVLKGDQGLLEPFLKGAEELERQGVTAITTSCGFLAMFQKELAAHVKVPVFASSLLQVAMVANLLPEDKCVGIMTADSSKLTDRHFRGVGAENVRKVVYGLQGTHFHHVFVGNHEEMDYDQAVQDMVGVAKQMVAEHPEVGAIVFECTNMPPYAKAVSEAVGLPVYDITTLANYVMNCAARAPFLPIGYP